MIEVQCPSCQTRYRIDESVLPAQDSPTFKCSRCGHVFSAEPRAARKAAAAPQPRPAPSARTAPSTPPAPASVPPVAPQNSNSQTSNSGASAQPPVKAGARRTGSSEDLRPSPPVRAEPIRDPEVANLFADVRRPARPADGSAAAAPIAPAKAATPSAPPTTAVAAAQPEADNPLARSFGEEEPRTPENLSFDFADDQAEQHELGDAVEAAEPEDPYERWHVGDPESEPASTPPPPEATIRYQPRRSAIAQGSRRIDRAAVAAEAAEHERRHNSGFFLGVFVLIGFFFVGVTFLLGLSPSISRELLHQLPLIGAEFTPVQPSQNVVALSEVHAEYRLLDGNRRALIVSGRAENRGAEPLHTIEVGVSLVDNQQHPVVTQSAFCGDLVSPKIVSQMTPHELQFFQNWRRRKTLRSKVATRHRFS